jgi:hypothetical protein
MRTNKVWTPNGY